MPSPAAPAILVVDDNRHIRRLLLELLQAVFQGSAILEAADGREALAQCARAKPQVVVMDVGLPDADGIELTGRIRLLFPQTAVVVLSSHEDGAYREAARRAGAVAFVGKSEVSSALTAAISGALAAQGNSAP